jgi:hypothetical protein
VTGGELPVSPAAGRAGISALVEGGVAPFKRKAFVGSLEFRPAICAEEDDLPVPSQTFEMSEGLMPFGMVDAVRVGTESRPQLQTTDAKRSKPSERDGQDSLRARDSGATTPPIPRTGTETSAC